MKNSLPRFTFIILAFISLQSFAADRALTRLPVDKSPTQHEIKGTHRLPPLKSLTRFAGRFNQETTRLDLVAQGLWGMKVRIVSDGQWNNVKLHAGDTGVIAWPTYVSQTIFNLAEEAPVMGLEFYPRAAIGIPWTMLEKLEDAPAPPQL